MIVDLIVHMMHAFQDTFKFLNFLVASRDILHGSFNIDEPNFRHFVLIVNVNNGIVEFAHDLLMERGLSFDSVLMLVLELLEIQIVLSLHLLNGFVELVEPESEFFIDPHHL